MTSLSKEDIIKLEYDKTFSDYSKEDFISIENCLDIDVYSEFVYVLFCNCMWDKNHRFFTIRIYRQSSVNGIYIIFLAPAIKKTENIELMAKVRVPLEVNRLGLVKGAVVEIDDIPIKYTNENSIYDPKLKRRVLLSEIQFKDKKTKKDKIKDTTEKVEKTSSKQNKEEVINNIDILQEFKPHSSQFLPPRVCTRIWTLNIGINTGWAWYLLDKNTYYCRPIEIEDMDLEYDRGGVLLTYAYLKSDFDILDNEVLCHENLTKMYIENGMATSAVLVLNVLIDSFLINWKE